MTGWREIKLKEVCEYVTVGYVGSMADEYVDEGIPFLRSLNIKPFYIDYNNLKFVSKPFHEKLKKSALRPGDVVVVRTGYPGTACVIPDDLPVSNCSDLVVVRPGKDLNSHFLAAFFNSAFGQTLVSGSTVGAAQQHFNVTVAKEIVLNLPEKKIQDKVGSVLSAYDDLIENNKRRIALLEKMAEEIYREWFVRFRFPGYQTAEFEKGIPKDWAYEKLDDLCSTIKRGISPKYDEESERLVINQKCIRNSQIDLSEARSHDTKTPNDKYIRLADALINSTGVGTLGRVSVVEYEPEKVTVDSHVTICRADPEVINPQYLSVTVSQLQHYFEFMASGSTGQVELNRSLIAGIKVRVPDRDIQDKFSEAITDIWKNKQNLFRSNKNLKQTKEMLLPRLISGKLSVADLDIQFPPSISKVEAA